MLPVYFASLVSHANGYCTPPRNCIGGVSALIREDRHKGR